MCIRAVPTQMATAPTGAVRRRTLVVVSRLLSMRHQRVNGCCQDNNGTCARVQAPSDKYPFANIIIADPVTTLRVATLRPSQVNCLISISLVGRGWTLCSTAIVTLERKSVNDSPDCWTTLQKQTEGLGVHDLRALKARLIDVVFWVCFCFVFCSLE